MDLFSLVEIAAPVPEVRIVIPLFLTEVQLPDISTGELGKAEQLCRPRLTRVVDPGDAEPHSVVFLHEKKMSVIVVTVQQEAVVCQGPELSGEQGKIRTLDLPGAGNRGMGFRRGLSCGGLLLGFLMYRRLDHRRLFR